MSDRALLVHDLRIETEAGVEIVDHVGFSIERGECLALVGESGCGKTSTALGVLGHARPGTRIPSGSVLLDGKHDMLGLPERLRRRLRGMEISYVPQDPTMALNPRQRVGRQVTEVLLAHDRSRDEATRAAYRLAERVGLPADESFMRRYPFELSGGQQQRVAIAMALIAEPAVVVLDEPTTGLDAHTQARVLDLLLEIASASDVSFLYVTHDLAVVDRLADRVAVMYAGRVVEEGPRADVFAEPAHPYTGLLLESVPRLSFRHELTGIAGTTPAPGRRSTACRFNPRCPLAIDVCRDTAPPPQPIGATRFVRCHRPSEAIRVVGHRSLPEPMLDAVRPLVLTVGDVYASYRSRRRVTEVLHGVSLDVGASECVALVGESGSGKSTLGRCIAGLHASDSGHISLSGEPLAARAGDRTAAQCQRVQLVFQNPERSLNPNRSVQQIVARPLRRFSGVEPHEMRARAEELMERVRLPASALTRYPRELSGGEKQRVAIARALAARPLLLVCDEITSALDVSIQAAIVALLGELRAEGLALLFITHNLALVNSIADNVVVLEHGRVPEVGPTTRILAQPGHPYTRTLLAAAPELRSDIGSREAI